MTVFTRAAYGSAALDADGIRRDRGGDATGTFVADTLAPSASQLAFQPLLKLSNFWYPRVPKAITATASYRQVDKSLRVTHQTPTCCRCLFPNAEIVITDGAAIPRWGGADGHVLELRAG
jgi:hypothetical protein